MDTNKFEHNADYKQGWRDGVRDGVMGERAIQKLRGEIFNEGKIVYLSSRGNGKTLAVRTILKKYIDKLPLDALERMYNVAIDYLNEGD